MSGESNHVWESSLKETNHTILVLGKSGRKGETSRGGGEKTAFKQSEKGKEGGVFRRTKVIFMKGGKGCLSGTTGFNEDHVRLINGLNLMYKKKEKKKNKGRGRGASFFCFRTG